MKIMIAFDHFTRESLILKTALAHAKAFKAEICMATSVDIGEDVPKEAFDKAEESLRTAKGFFEEQGIPCTTQLIETGLSTGENLVAFAKENKVSQMVIGVRSRSKLGKFIFGSTAQYIILNAPCPVLSINE